MERPLIYSIGYALIFLAIFTFGLAIFTLVKYPWKAPFWIASYIATNTQIAEKRYELAQTRDRQSVTANIAIVWPNDRLAMGACLAAKELKGTCTDGLAAKDAKEWNGTCKPKMDKQDEKNDVQETEWTIPKSEGEKRKIEINVKRYSVPRREEVFLAEKLARDPTLVAVIGHSGSDIAIKASVSYEWTKLVFFAVNATDPALTNHGFSYVFRTIPSDDVLTANIAQALREMVYCRRTGTFYARSNYALRYVDILLANLSEQNIANMFEKSYNLFLSSLLGSIGAAPNADNKAGLKKTETELSLRRMIREAFPTQYQDQEDKVNIIVLADDWPANARDLIQILAKVQIYRPVIGGLGLDSSELLPNMFLKLEQVLFRCVGQECHREVSYDPETQPGEMCEADAGFAKIIKMYVTSVFRRDSPAVEALAGKFEACYGDKEPFDFIVLQGYEIVRILAEAFSASDELWESIAPFDVAPTLKSGKAFRGLTDNKEGKIFFNQYGDLQWNKEVFIKAVGYLETSSSP